MAQSEADSTKDIEHINVAAAGAGSLADGGGSAQITLANAHSADLREEKRRCTDAKQRNGISKKTMKAVRANLRRVKSSRAQELLERLSNTASLVSLHKLPVTGTAAKETAALKAGLLGKQCPGPSRTSLGVVPIHHRNLAHAPLHSASTDCRRCISKTSPCFGGWLCGVNIPGPHACDTSYGRI